MFRLPFYYHCAGEGVLYLEEIILDSLRFRGTIWSKFKFNCGMHGWTFIEQVFGRIFINDSGGYDSS